MTSFNAESATTSPHASALDHQDAGPNDVMNRIYRVAAAWGEMPVFPAVQHEELEELPQPILAVYAAVLSVLLEDAHIVNGLDIVLSHRKAVETCWDMGTPVERTAYMFLSVQ